MGAVLTESQGLYHRWEYSPPGGGTSHVIDYRGGSARTGTVAVDGEIVAVDVAKGRAERFRFNLGSDPALLEVTLDLMMKIKALKLIVDGATVYTEGEAQAFTSPEEQQALQAGPRTPAQLQVEQSPEAVEIRYRESIFQSVILIITGISLAAIGAFLYSQSNSSLNLIDLVLVLFGVVVIYMSVAKLVNRTTIRLDHQELSLRRGPLPSLGRKPASQIATQIEGFTTEQIVRRNRNTRTTVYQLVARMQNGEQVDFLEDPSQEVIVAMRNALAQFQARR
jgi:hypothetical protein